MSDSWTAAETALARHLIESGMDAQQVAEEFARSGLRRTHQSIRRKKQREGWHAKVRPNPPGARRFDQPVSVTSERALLLFDIHAPFHDSRFLNDLIELALRERVDTIGIGGDLVDFTAFGIFGRQLGIEAGDEIEAAAQIIRTLTQEFEHVIYSGGNHEMRVIRTLKDALPLAAAMRKLLDSDNATITDYHWFELHSGGERYYVEHPKNASVSAGTVPAKLAAKYGCHVVSGHGHLWGMTRDVSGRYYGIDAGICADPYRLAYIQQQHSTRPQVCQGAVLVKDGVPWLLDPQMVAHWN